MLLILLFSQEDHFGLSRISRISIEITTSNDPPLSLPPLVPSGNQGNIAGTARSNMREADGDETRDESGDPFVGLEFKKIINPI
jgi:hypothetical protein